MTEKKTKLQKKLYKMDTSNILDAEFKALVIRIFNEFRGGVVSLERTSTA